MNDEPTYVYQKGVGWVATSETDSTFVCVYTDVDGATWRVYDRKPNVGERWSVTFTGQCETIEEMLEWFTRNQEPLGNIGTWESIFATFGDRYVTFLPDD